MKRIPVGKLRADCLDSKPTNVDDWREIFRDIDSEVSQFWDTSTCEECGEVIVLHMGGGDETQYLDSESECEGHVGYGEGPMMNYWYPVDNHVIDIAHARIGPEAAARAISGVPLCVVQVNGVYGLALTGGGMDLTWEICAAFIALGQLPPAHFAGKLPLMSGRGDSPSDRYIVSACRAALRARIDRTTRDLRDLRRNFGRKEGGA